MLADDLLRAALDEALGSGGGYGGAGAESGVGDAGQVGKGGVGGLGSGRDSGWGIHALAGGGWGFASSSLETLDEVREVARRAVEIARAAGTRRRSRSDLSLMPTWQGEYASELERDPFSVPAAERVEL